MSIPSSFQSNKTNLINSNNFLYEHTKMLWFLMNNSAKKKKMNLSDTKPFDNDFIATSFRNMSGAVRIASHLGGMYIFTPTFERN